MKGVMGNGPYVKKQRKMIGRKGGRKREGGKGGRSVSKPNYPAYI